MSFGDKPIVNINDAQKAAAIAKQAADAANQASQVVSSVAPPGQGRDIALKVLGAVGVVGGTVATALTAGTLPAIIAGAAATATYLAGLFHSTPGSKQP